ncbi:MAG: DUF4398 domain-containing protein [Thermoanaerobaculia bacterium]
MRNPIRHRILFGFFLLLSAVGCRRSPRREIEQAKTDLAAALRVQAQVYAPASFQEARRALEGAQRLVREKRYSDARVLALESSSRSRGALGISAENREKMLAALRGKVEATERELLTASDEMKIAEARGVGADSLQLFASEIVEANARQAEARRRLAARDLIQGKKWADDADVATSTLLRDIQFSIARKQSEPVPRKRAARQKSR